MRLLRCWVLAIGASAALTVSLAFAAPDAANPYPECARKPTPSELEGAKGAHKAASQFYERGDYEKAIRYWTDAYGFDCNAHSVLINIGNAYEKKGDKAAAVVALETYLKRAGADATIEAKVANLKALLAPPPPVPTAEPTVAPIATVAPTAVPTAEPPSGPRPFGYKPWIVVGSGAAVAIAGAVLLPIGLGSVAEIEKICPPPDHKCPDDGNLQANIDKGNTGRVLVAAGIGTLAVGGATIIGGLVWQLAFNKPGPATTGAAGRLPNAIRVLPAVGPTDRGVTVVGTF